MSFHFLSLSSGAHAGAAYVIWEIFVLSAILDSMQLVLLFTKGGLLDDGFVLRYEVCGLWSEDRL